MAGRVVLAVLAVATMAGCRDDLVGGCSGAAVIVSAVSSSPVGGNDGGTDADTPTDGGGGDARPSCTGRCIDYLEMLGAAIEAATPSSCEVQLMYGNALICAPLSRGGSCGTPVDEASALHAQIRDYLGVAWPELDSPTLNTCVCTFN